MLEGKLNLILDVVCPTYNIIQYTNYMFNPAFVNVKKLLGQNRKFYNIHRNNRCFILGNGPSLNDDDLSVLRDEIVFTVNQAYRHKQFSSLHSNYHFWIDENFFKVDTNNDPTDLEMFETMRKVAEEQRISCFYPSSAYKLIKKYGLDRNNNAYYLYPKLRFYDHYDLRCDISKLMPSFGTVVQYAIFAAVYMGIKEIYLLGCDSTGIMSTLNAILKTSNDTYAYKVTDVEKKRMEHMVARASVVDYAYTYYTSLKAYKILYNYCKKRNVTLCNCSKHSVLDMLPYAPMEDIVSK